MSETAAMEPVPPAPELSPLVRFGFMAVFVAVCLHNPALGVRVGGIFLLGVALYQGVLGRVPRMLFYRTIGYVKGPAAMVSVVITIFVAMFFILAPDLVIRFLAEAKGLPQPH